MLSVRDMAGIFGREPRTIRSWVACGLLQPVKADSAVFIPGEQAEALLDH
jgi:hypothetical protein